MTPPAEAPALLTTFTLAAEEVCLSPHKPDWNKAAGDAGRFFLEMLQQSRAARAAEDE